MRRGRALATSLISLALAALAACGGDDPTPTRTAVAVDDGHLVREAASRPTVPATRRGDLVETIHGEAVADPYRWLEKSDDAEVEAWDRAQTAHTKRMLSRVPGRDALRKAIREEEFTYV